jgi:hypothetical protein
MAHKQRSNSRSGYMQVLSKVSSCSTSINNPLAKESHMGKMRMKWHRNTLCLLRERSLKVTWQKVCIQRGVNN